MRTVKFLSNLTLLSALAAVPCSAQDVPVEVLKGGITGAGTPGAAPAVHRGLTVHAS
jgi:hypothetical protein